MLDTAGEKTKSQLHCTEQCFSCCPMLRSITNATTLELHDSLKTAIDIGMYVRQGWNGLLIYRVGSGTKYAEISGPGRVGSVARVTLRYQPTIVLCCINRAQILNQKIHYRSTKLGHLCSCLSEILGVSCFYTCKDSQFNKSLASKGRLQQLCWCPLAICVSINLIYQQWWQRKELSFIYNSIINCVIIKSKELWTEQSISP